MYPQQQQQLELEQREQALREQREQQRQQLLQRQQQQNMYQNPYLRSDATRNIPALKGTTAPSPRSSAHSGGGGGGGLPEGSVGGVMSPMLNLFGPSHNNEDSREVTRQHSDARGRGREVQDGHKIYRW
jgi:hypothetical protein